MSSAPCTAGDSADFIAEEAIWDWVREEVTTNTYCGTAANVRGRCRTILQSGADALMTIA